MQGAIVIEGHVQGLSNCRSLGELGIPIYVVDVVHCLAQHSKYCKKHFICPAFNSPEFITFLIDLAKHEQLQGWFLIGSNDHIVENLSLHRAELEPYYTMIVPTEDNLYKIINKQHLLEVASVCGTRLPATRYIGTLEQTKRMRFPLLIKGNLGLSFYKATHQKAIQVNNEQELAATIHQLERVVDDVMIQELIPFDKKNRVVSFTCFAERGEIRTYWMGQKLREHPIKYGTATMAQSVLLPEVLEEARPLVKALNYTGICEIEFMRDPRDGHYYLIEINPRTWLWVGLAKACGVDYAKIMYQYAMGIEQTYPTNYQVGKKWRNAITDLVFGMQAIIASQISIREYIASLSGSISHAIWDWKDILPGIVFPFMMIHIARTRR